MFMRSRASSLVIAPVSIAVQPRATYLDLSHVAHDLLHRPNVRAGKRVGPLKRGSHRTTMHRGTDLIREQSQYGVLEPGVRQELHVHAGGTEQLTRVAFIHAPNLLQQRDVCPFTRRGIVGG